MEQNNNENFIKLLRKWAIKCDENSEDFCRDFYRHIKSAHNKHEFKIIMKSKLSDSDFLILIKLIINLTGNPSEFRNCPLIIKCIITDEFFDRVFSFLKMYFKQSTYKMDDLLLLVQFYESVIHYLPICSNAYEKTYAILEAILECLRINEAKSGFAEGYERTEELLDVLRDKEYQQGRKNFSYIDMDAYPSAVDLFESHTVSPSIIKGPYKDSEQYLDINFKLLKADFVNAIKEGFELYKTKQKKGLKSNSNFFFYENVMSKRLIIGRNAKSRICHVLEFSNEDIAILKRENWDISKKFMNGSLLFFTRNDFTTFTVATVENNLWALTKGRLKTIYVSVIGNPFKIKINTPYKMVEPRVFFEPYYQSLRMFHVLNTTNFPMGENVILASKEEISSDLISKSSLCHISNGRFCYKGDDLNSSQRDALNGALSKKFTLIQGPPGTGKSHLTRKIISILAGDPSDNRPVLVVCMRNKALDIILEPLVASGLSIVRLGRTENEVLEMYTLYNWKEIWGRCKSSCSKFLKNTISSFRKTIKNRQNGKNTRAIKEAFKLHRKATDACRVQADYYDGQKILLNNIKIIGATTTGAAKRNAMLSEINPKAVIIEEAAEILEPFLIASLPLSCEHLILIGDHLQLQPITSSHQSEKYNLHISFFERMVMNGKHYHQLTVQHRMRPEIAELICPLIYKNVTNDSSVYKYPDIVGVGKNVFFIDHSSEECYKGESKSYLNPYEADFLLSLANYLVQQGYSSNAISILAAYSAQQNYLIQHHSQYPLIAGMEIQTIDNYQGDENEIILLSLVRSNGPTIGFLSKPNRVNVALTRAKMGLYIIGNMKTLSKRSSLWKDINNLLKEKECIGKEIPLKCKAHERITHVSKPEQIQILTLGQCTNRCRSKAKR